MYSGVMLSFLAQPPDINITLKHRNNLKTMLNNDVLLILV